MPSWTIHLKTAKELENSLKIEENQFCIGNLLPDAERKVIKDFSYFVPYPISHYQENIVIQGVEQRLPKPSLFYNKYAQQMNNPIILGYLVHLLTDYFWNKTTFKKAYKVNNSDKPIVMKVKGKEQFLKDREQIRILKTHDFQLFSAQIQKTEQLPKITHSKEIIKSLEVLQEIPAKKEDIDKMIRYVNTMLKEEEHDTNYFIFTPKEMQEEFQKSIEFIKDFLKKHNTI